MTAEPQTSPGGSWVAVCRVGDIRREGGVAALVRGEAVAVFRTHDDAVFALGNVEPVSGASVLSRGIVGTRGEVPFVASPMHKQPYGLRDGWCLDDPALAVPAYAVRVVGGVVQVGPRLDDLRDPSDPRDPLVRDETEDA